MTNEEGEGRKEKSAKEKRVADFKQENKQIILKLFI